MSKLPSKNQFLDLSDYGRPFARFIAQSLKNTSFTPIHVTIGFVISGLIAIACIFHEYYWATAFFLILKSILDAADGELARIKKTPSYTGRYLDSLSDIILNFILLATIWHVTNGKITYTILAFISIQLQGTLYNYYYVILRNKHNGDTTSRVFEDNTPKALPGEKQRTVNILFILYKVCYGIFDKIIYKMDKNAVSSKKLPNWLMTAVSTFGLGFQLLIISIMFVLNLKDFIVPFFIAFSGLIFIFIAIRRYINR
ncbi:CDP-alcohol phosphatidyltransferase family protein [Cellulophaga sp. HaHaR_3_176]|uniref:CDP-alcohol phosphatidyltransferase family protein n=1 Tax=Cellulophaga sp. HaHaR_3_176 TaxID=1942464 RepID=UPI001C1F82CC|nr:CDP-alcohol phosphatidyltransferase family protein [Cellulophaga sp. HaHaR_3_176]QWX85537.1 CDP-alcohol phosphatidyltransferase family protein [Cellulophaga sp. HaHaR_3_176]